jgi:iron complex transport system substrate-binding protein
VRQIKPPPKTISLNATRLDQVFVELRNLGAATGREKAAAALIGRLQQRIAEVRNAVGAAARKPRVWCCEWLEPLMAAGHWMPELIELAGGLDGLVNKGAASRWLHWDQVREYDPEVILVMPCSYTMPQTMREKERLLKRPGWSKLSAVKAGKVFAVDSGLFQTAGPRLVEGLELLAGLIHPEFNQPRLVKRGRSAPLRA